MKKALVISFFKSNNLGDLALSSAIEKLISDKGYKILKYDFTTATRVTKIITELSSNIQPKEKSKLKLLLRSIISVIKKLLIYFYGGINIERIYFYLHKTIIAHNKWKVLEKEIQNVDIVILAGGNMLMDMTPSWPTIFEYYSSLARKYKKDLNIIYVGVGPIYYRESKKIYRKALKNAKRITVRDHMSKEICRDLINDIVIVETADPVFSLPIDWEDDRIYNINKGNSEANFKIGICVLANYCFSTEQKYRDYLEGLCKLICSLSMLSPKKIEYILFSTEIADYVSVKILQDKLYLYNCDNTRIIYINTVDELVELYKKLNFLIGGRMHSLIFAQKCLLPYIGIVWQNKIKGFGNVTKSSSRIYEICYINSNTKSIAQDILKNIVNIDLIKQMSVMNDKIINIVHKGNII